MKILVVNDDGVHSQGIIQLAKVARKYGEVFVVAPRVEQSGVSQAITFLSPLFPIALGGVGDTQDDQIPGYSVNGTPVDCVKLALEELCPWKPDLVLSGINGGLNAGINVNYSGTVGAALAAATFDIPSIAISLEYSEEHMDFEQAAKVASPLVDRFSKVELPPGCAVNINIPTIALTSEPEISFVPVETNVMAYHFDRGNDPKGRPYFWSTNRPDPEPSAFETDAQALQRGKVAVSVVNYDINSEHGLKALSTAASEGDS